MAETLEALRATLEAKRAAIEKQAQPLYEKLAAVQAKMAPLEKEAYELHQQIKAIERPVLGDVCRDLAAIARATKGTRSMAAEPEGAK